MGEEEEPTEEEGEALREPAGPDADAEELAPRLRVELPEPVAHTESMRDTEELLEAPAPPPPELEPDWLLLGRPEIEAGGVAGALPAALALAEPLPAGAEPEGEAQADA